MIIGRTVCAILVCGLGLAVGACAAQAPAPTAAPTAAPKAAAPVAPTAAATAAAVKAAATAVPTTAPTAAPKAATQAPAKAETTTIRLGHNTNYFVAPLLVGMREKMFEQEGLKVEFTPFSMGRNAVAALVAGSLDMATMAAQPFITSTAKGEGGIVTIGIVGYNGKGSALVAAKDSGVAKVEDLKGKKIGMPVGSSTHFILTTKLLPSSGLTPNDYQLVNLDQANLVSTLSVRAVDAFGGSDPAPIQAEINGIGKILTDFSKYDAFPALYVGHKSFILSNPNTVVKFLRAQLRASKLIQDDFPKASQHMREYMASQKVDLSAEVADRMLANVDPVSFFIPTMSAYLQEYAENDMKQGNITSIPKWDQVVLSEYLDRAAAELGVKNPYK